MERMNMNAVILAHVASGNTLVRIFRRADNDGAWIVTQKGDGSGAYDYVGSTGITSFRKKPCQFPVQFIDEHVDRLFGDGCRETERFLAKPFNANGKRGFAAHWKDGNEISDYAKIADQWMRLYR